MKTFFALHGITNRNKDSKELDSELEKLGYDESKLSIDQSFFMLYSSFKRFYPYTFFYL